LSRLDRLRARPRLLLGALALLVLAAALAAVCLGPLRLAPGVLWAAATGRLADLPAVDRSVLLVLRLPRALGAVLVGGVLGLCGAAMQGLFRNPLADPGLVGVTSGASFGAALQVKFAATSLAGVSAFLGQFSLPAFALAGGLLATLVMHRASQVEGRTVVALMLLAGVALNALFGAGIGLVLFFADDDQLRQFTFWTLGSLGRVTWAKLAAAAPFLHFAARSTSSSSARPRPATSASPSSG
jgi:iron complex transport system permease protein